MVYSCIFFQEYASSFIVEIFYSLCYYHKRYIVCLFIGSCTEHVRDMIINISADIRSL